MKKKPAGPELGNEIHQPTGSFELLTKARNPIMKTKTNPHHHRRTEGRSEQKNKKNPGQGFDLK